MNKYALPLVLTAIAVPFSLFLCGCSDPAASFAEIPTGFPIPEPSDPVQDMQMCESFTVEIEDRIFYLARNLEAGEWESFGEVLSLGFYGDSLAGLTVLEKTPQLHDSRHVRFDPASAQKVDCVGFLAGFVEMFGQWQNLEFARWEILQAEFQPGRPTWAKALLQLEVLGLDKEGQVRSVTIEFDTQFVQDRDKWVWHAAEIQSLESWVRAKTLFTDISRESGIGYQGLPAEDSSPFPFRHLRLPYNGAACGDVNGDGIWDLFVSGKERNFLYLGSPSGSFAEVSLEWGVLKPADGSGAVFFDYDNDGDQDLAVAGEGYLKKDGTEVSNHLRMYRNDGNRFQEVSEELGLRSFMFSYSLAVLDYDMDGFLDLYVCNYGQFGLSRNNSWDKGDNGSPDALFRNLEGKGFESVEVGAGVDDRGWSFAVAVADYDRDGDQDIYVAHDYARNAFFNNQGNGTFKDVAAVATAEDLGFGMGASWCDLNNDGLLDLYIANMHVPVAERIIGRLDSEVTGMGGMTKLSRGNTILFQREDGTFELSPEELGGIRGRWAWGCTLNDFDLDGRIDVFCTNGYITRSGPGDMNSYFWRHVISSTTDVSMEPTIYLEEQPNNKAFTKGQAQLAKQDRSWSGHERDKLWFNRGSEGFLDLSDVSGVDSPGDGRAVIAADFDDDGDVDLFLNEWSHQDMNHQILLRNDIQQTPSGFLKVQLRATTSQYQAVGAEVIVQTPAGPCTQVLSLGSGFLSCNPPELIFGLGQATSASVEVIWPGAIRESFQVIPSDSRVLLVEGSGKAAPLPSRRASQ